MDKKTERKIQRDARRTAKVLNECTDEQYEGYIDYLAQKEVALGTNISKTTRRIKKLEDRPRINNVSDFGKLEATALGCVATVGAAVALSMMGGFDEAQTFVTAGIGAVAGGGLGRAVAEFYNKKPISNAVSDIVLHHNQKRLAKLTKEKEESEYFLDALDNEMSKW